MTRATVTRATVTRAETATRAPTTPRRIGARVLIWALAAFASASWALAGCGPEQEAPRRSVTALPNVDDPTQGAVLSEELMLALSLAKNYHHKADLLAQEAEFAEAGLALRAILDIRFPDGAPEAEDVRLDARARLAKLLMAQGQLDQALEVVEAGLRAPTRRSFFVANLYTVKGEIYEARANALDEARAAAVGSAGAAADERAQPDPAAGEARREAIRAFDESIRINRALQKALLGEDDP